MRRLLDHGALLADIEEGPLAEAQRGGEQCRGELLDAGVVLLHRVVEEPPRRRDLVLDVGQFGLKLLEVLVGLEVRIGLGQREQLPQRA